MDAASVPAVRGRIIPLTGRLLRALDDERLVGRIRAGDQRAFEVLYDRHHRGLLSLCRHILGSREEAEDALQQTFASAHRELFEGERELHVRAWLYTVARNRCLTMLRARREQPVAEVDRASVEGLAEEVEHREELKALVADIRDLPEEQRTALVLSEVGDLTHADIAATLGCEVSKVKSLVFQARSGLIERREAREVPCEQIREQLSVLTGGSLRRGHIRRHLQACPGCREFREEVRRQRVMLGVVLPAIPSVGLKESALAALGIGGGAAGGGGLAAGLVGASGAGAPAGGTLAASLGAAFGKAGAVKLAVVAVAGTAAAGGGVAVVASDRGDAGSVAPPAAIAPAPGGGQPGEPAPPAAKETGGPSAERREDAASRRERAAERRRRAPGRERGRDRAGSRGDGSGKAGGGRGADGRGRPEASRKDEFSRSERTRRHETRRRRTRTAPRARAPRPGERSPGRAAPAVPDAADDSGDGEPPGQRRGKGKSG